LGPHFVNLCLWRLTENQQDKKYWLQICRSFYTELAWEPASFCCGT
jgi:hypothetical protein